MLTFEAPLVRVRLGGKVGFADRLPPPSPSRIHPLARTLALGHRLVRAVEAGEVRDFSDAARRMGVSQARVSMLVVLTFLAPQIQAGLLLGTGPRVSHKKLLRIARIDDWEAQLEAMEATRSRQRVSGRKSPIHNPCAGTGRNLAQNLLESAEDLLEGRKKCNVTRSRALSREAS
jgi:hypothetical protein